MALPGHRQGAGAIAPEGQGKVSQRHYIRISHRERAILLYSVANAQSPRLGIRPQDSGTAESLTCPAWASPTTLSTPSSQRCKPPNGKCCSRGLQLWTCLFHQLLRSVLVRIGIDAMLHLLTETSIFVALPNECLCQVTGEPVVHTVLASRHLDEGARSAIPVPQRGKKRRRIKSTDDSGRPQKRIRSTTDACESVKLKTVGLKTVR